MEASQEGHLELVRYLLEAGAGVNATTGQLMVELRDRMILWRTIVIEMISVGFRQACYEW